MNVSEILDKIWLGLVGPEGAPYVKRDEVEKELETLIAKREVMARLDELNRLIPEFIAEMANINYEDELKRMYDDLYDRIVKLDAELEQLSKGENNVT